MFRRGMKMGQLSLRMQITLAMASVVLVTAVAVAYIGHDRLNEKIDEDIETRTLWSLRVATRIFAEGAPIFMVERNAANEPERLKLTSPAASSFDNFSPRELSQIVDSISEANRGTATIFRWREEKKDFERVATTVKKPDGSRATGTFLGQNGAVYPFMMRKEAYRGVANILGEPYQTGYLPILDPKGEPAGILYIGVGKMSELRAVSGQFTRALFLGSSIILLFVLGIAIYLTQRLLRPIGQVAAATDALASGRENVEIPCLDRKDQVGLIARAVEGFAGAVSRQREQERASAEEALRMAARKEEMDQMVQSFRTIVQDQLGKLRQGADRVLATSETIRKVVSTASDRVSDGVSAADDGANAISEVALATNQFASSIAEIAARSNDAATVVRNATDIGKHAESIAGELSVAVSKISTAVAFISSIASQTNLLALNATIEAARAGDAGKGFAVVASEVKELSNGTSRAATEIAELVKGIENVTTAVTQATREIGQGLVSINETTLVIAAAVTEQEQVTRGIAGNADSAAQRSDVVRSGFAEVQGAIENTAGAANELEQLSKEFAVSSDQLVDEIETFLRRMAA